MADQNKPKSKSAKKPVGVVFDVRRPGKAPAPPTSRPVIVGHKPEAQVAQTAVSGVGEADPILIRRKIQITPSGDIQTAEVEPQDDTNSKEVRSIPAKEQEALAIAAMDAVATPPDLSEHQDESSDNTAAQKDRSALFTKSRLMIKPPSEGGQAPDAESADSAESATEELSPEESVDTGAKQDLFGKAADESEANQESQGTEMARSAIESGQHAALSDVVEEAASNTEAQDAVAVGEEAEQEQKPEPHIEPLFDNHGVIVSHHSHHHQGHGLKIFALLLAILILAAAILNILLDLEILNLEDIPHTDYL